MGGVYGEGLRGLDEAGCGEAEEKEGAAHRDQSLRLRLRSGLRQSGGGLLYLERWPRLVWVGWSARFGTRGEIWGTSNLCWREYGE